MLDLVQEQFVAGFLEVGKSLGVRGVGFRLPRGLGIR